MKEHNYIKTSEIFANAKEHIAEEVGAAAIIAVKDGRVCAYITGLDPLGIHPDSVAIAAAMSTLLDGKLSISKAIFDKASENGKAEVVSLHEETVERYLHNDNGNEKSAKNDSPMSTKELLKSLIDNILGDDDDEEGDEDASDT